ncbi:MAG: PEPxxWA-CTERM sorting domain-containing protein [Phenylobacterium sp.]
MGRVVCGALSSAAVLAFAGSVRADTFTLSNTTHPDCHAEFGAPPGYDCAKMTANGFATPIPGGYALTGPDLIVDVTGLHSTTTLTAIADVDETLVYDWDYFSQDTISAFFDPAGFILDGQQAILVQNYFTTCQSPGPPCVGLYRHQTGTVTFNLLAGQNYGFYVFSTDSEEGAGHISFTLASRTGVPEPAAWALLILGFGGIGAQLRRRGLFETVEAA